MKGIISKDIIKDDILRHYIFVYYSQCNLKDECKDLVYRYELDDKKNVLIHPKVLFSLKSSKDSIKDEGIIRLGPDNILYLNIENVQKEYGSDDSVTLKDPTKREMSWMECFIQTGLADNIASKLSSEIQSIGSDNGHGISGSFGADFDPYSGELWYLEEVHNGAEISMLGQLADNSSSTKTDLLKKSNQNENFFCVDRDYHAALKHTEEENIALKSLLFLHTQYMGKKNNHNLLVSSDTNQIFEFDLNGNRNDLIIPAKLEDVQNSQDSNDTKRFVFAEGFNGLLDIRVNPYDGFLYILDKKTEEYDEESGTIYRIEKNTDETL